MHAGRLERQRRIGSAPCRGGASVSQSTVRGSAAAGASWGGGGQGTKAEARINPDGSVEVRCGTQDLGTGTRTVIALVAAEMFGLDPEQIHVQIGDTQFPLLRRQRRQHHHRLGRPAIYDACTKALAELQQQSGVADARGAALAGGCKKLGVDPLVAHRAMAEGLSSSGAGGVQFAEVEVDTETGFVKRQEGYLRSGLRPGGEPADLREPGQRRHHHGHRLRALRGARDGPADRRGPQPQLRDLQTPGAWPTCRRSTSCCSTCPSAE